MRLVPFEFAAYLSLAFDFREIEELQLGDRFPLAEVVGKAVVANIFPDHPGAGHEGPFALNPVEQAFGNQVEDGGSDRPEAHAALLGHLSLRRNDRTRNPATGFDPPADFLLKAVVHGASI